MKKRSYRRKSRRKKSKRKSRKLKKDGVKKSNILLPLLASSFLGSSEALYKEPSRFSLTDNFNEYSCSITPDSIFYKLGETDLNFAIKNGNNDCTKFLITDSTVNKISKAGETPLSIALYSLNYEIAEYLIKNGADVNMKSRGKYLPLTETSDLRLIKLLLENGAIIDYNDKYIRYKIKHNFRDLNKEYIKLFTEYGLDLTLKDDNNIPLYIYSMLANVFVIYDLNILKDLISLLLRSDDLVSIIKIFIGSYSLGNVLKLLYDIYLYLKKYIKIKKINIRLFKSLESIEKIVENMNLVNMLNDKLIIYPETIGQPLLQFITILYFSYKYKNSCIPTIPTIPIGGKKLFKELKRIIKKGGFKWSYSSLIFSEKEKKIKISDFFWKNFKTCLMKPEVIFIILPLVLVDKDYKTGHANFLIYNTKDKSLERFEPHGNYSGGIFNFDDNLILELFNKEMGKDFIKQYYKPLDFCPYYSVQTLEKFEKDFSQGFCSTWCYFYVDLRLSNPDVDRKDLVDNMIYQITYNEKSFTKFIKEYSIILVQIYNKVLEQVEKGEKIEDIYTKIISDFLPV